MRDRQAIWSKWFSWGIAGTSILVSLLAPVSVLAGWSDADLGDDLPAMIGTAMFLLVGPVYGTVGAAIVSTQPRNSIGWVMVFVCTGMTASVLAEVLVPVERPDFVSVPVAILLVLGSLAWVFFIFPVVGVLAGVVAVVSAVVGTRFQSPLVVAATTLGVAAVFNPLRRRIQVAVDRRFNRTRYDVERVMDTFAQSLRERLDADSIIDGWKGVVSETMQPSGVGVWVRSA